MPKLLLGVIPTTSVAQLDEYFQVFRHALASWNQSQNAVYCAVEESNPEGWLIAPDGSVITPGSEAGLAMIRSRMCSLEAMDDSDDFRLIGAIRIDGKYAGLIREANAGRVELDQATATLRRLRLADLERIPQAIEIPGISTAHWAEMKPSSAIWRAITAAAGVPRIQIRFAVRHLHLEGIAVESPRLAAFSTTKQCISSRRTVDEVRSVLVDIYEDDDLRADAARRDLAKLDCLEAMSPVPAIAYRYFGGEVTHINFAWADGVRRRVTSTLPLFFTDEAMKVVPPKSKDECGERAVRSDKKYGDQPIFESVQLYTDARL